MHRLFQLWLFRGFRLQFRRWLLLDAVLLISRNRWEVKLPDLHLFGRRRQGFGNTKIVGHFVTLFVGGVLLDRTQVGKRVVLTLASRGLCDVFDAIIRLKNLLQT